MPLHRRSALLRLAPVVLLTGLGLVGCEGNNPYPMSSIYPESNWARQIQELYQLLFWLSVPVFLIVMVALAITLIRFRARPGQGLPPQIHGNTRLEVAWTLGPAIILAIMAVPTVRDIFASYRPAPGTTPMPIEVIGHQFWWEVRYPEQGIVTANEIHIPVGREVAINLTSADVMHSFWVPRLAGKRDLMPNHLNQIFFTADRPGYYYGQCGEFCGLSHANMRFRVITQTQADFDQWVAQQREQQASVDRGAQLFQQKACVTCHVIQGLPYAQNNVGPNLTHLGSRTTIAAGVLENNPQNLAAWIENPQAIKPGALMPAIQMTPEERTDLVNYLLSLK